MTNDQVPGLYHRRIGEVLVTAVSDGYIDAPYSVLQNISREQAEQILTAEFRPTPPRISVNCYLIQFRDRIAIVDTGSGETMGPTLGKMPSLLGSLGVKIESIDTVLLTHMHPDHSNGLSTSKGKDVFTNAEVVIAERDMAHWHDDGSMAKANASQRERYFQGARFQIAPYKNRLKSASGEVFPHVTAIDLPGHTPGHTGFFIESEGVSLLIWGDICHVPDIQVRVPKVSMAFDTDPEAAIATRLKTFDMVSQDKILVAGMHLHFPGFSYIVKENDGYRMIPEGWTFNT